MHPNDPLPHPLYTSMTVSRILYAQWYGLPHPLCTPMIRLPHPLCTPMILYAPQWYGLTHPLCTPMIRSPASSTHPNDTVSPHPLCTPMIRSLHPNDTVSRIVYAPQRSPASSMHPEDQPSTQVRFWSMWFLHFENTGWLFNTFEYFPVF